MGTGNQDNKRSFMIFPLSPAFSLVFFIGLSALSYSVVWLTPFLSDGKILRDYKGMKSPLNIQGLDNVVNMGNQEYSVIKYVRMFP